jgi:hypothetical protein
LLIEISIANSERDPSNNPVRQEFWVRTLKIEAKLGDNGTVTFFQKVVTQD